jgi:hypothetical protein
MQVKQLFKKKWIQFLVPLVLICSLVYAQGLVKIGYSDSNSDNNWTEVVGLDGKLRTLSLPYGDAIAHGIIPDHVGINKFGANESVGTSEELIWPESNGRTYLTSAEQLQVSSTDADDTAAGTGARTVLLTGQTGAYVEITETVTLNGLTAVETVNSFYRIYRAKVVTAGSSGINEGTINIRDNADTNLKALISANRGQSELLFFTIPAGKKGFMPHIQAGESANKRVTIRCYARDNTVTDAAWQLKATLVVNNNESPKPLFIPLVFTEKTDIRFMAESALAGGDVHGSFSLYYEDQ